MALYITPDRFRTMHFGSDLSAFDDKDADLAAILSRASGLVDAYCNVPLRPQRHSFLGGSIQNEQHSWRLAQTPFESTQRRVYPYHSPVRTVSQFRIYVTQPDPDVEDGQYVSVAASDLMVNRLEDYVEVVSSAMTSTGLFNALIVPSIYLASPVATIDYTYGYTFAVSDERLYPTDALTYQSQNNFWTTDDVTVYADEVVVSGGYAVDRHEGAIVFDTPPAIGAAITADYHHKLPVEIRDATGHIASALIEDASITARGLKGLSSIQIAEVRLVRDRVDSDPVAYVRSTSPQAALLLEDFRYWRAAG